MPKTIILGTRMGGFGTAYQFQAEGVTPVCMTRRPITAGHTASFQDSGFILDHGSPSAVAQSVHTVAASDARTSREIDAASVSGSTMKVVLFHRS
jgi:protoporphyrinogen oxidase